MRIKFFLFLGMFLLILSFGSGKLIYAESPNDNSNSGEQNSSSVTDSSSTQNEEQIPPVLNRDSPPQDR